MRFRKSVLCVIVVVAVALLAAPTQAQEQPIPYDTCELGKWQVDVLYAGRVSCEAAYAANPAFVEAPSSGECTGVRYTVVSGNTNQIAQAAVLAYNPSYLYPDLYVGAVAGPTSSNVVNDPCIGDSATNSGIGSCHEQAIRYNPDDVADGPFWFVVPGVRQLSATTLTLKSNKINRCEILGVGDLMDENVLPAGCVPSCGNFDPDQQILKSEIIQFDECFVQFDFDLFTGEIVDFYLPQVCDPSSSGCCDLSVGCGGGSGDQDCCAWDPINQEDVDKCNAFEIEGGVESLELVVDGDALPSGTAAKTFENAISFGFGNFGDGYLSTGDDSCTCRMFAGKVFCWGSPCPAYSLK
jgi:hypothetical protein